MGQGGICLQGAPMSFTAPKSPTTTLFPVSGPPPSSSAAERPVVIKLALFIYPFRTHVHSLSKTQNLRLGEHGVRTFCPIQKLT